MNVLVVKMSSLGDIVHTLPALTDASRALPGIRFDWVVEEAFIEIPAWHPAVDTVIPVALRRWRRHPLRDFRGPEWAATKANLRRRRYDVLIDAQGLLKSAFIARLVPTTRYGMDWRSAREGLAAAAYQCRIPVPVDLHAIERTRLLFARALDYPLPEEAPDFGLAQAIHCRPDAVRPAVLFFHGSAGPDKLWPEQRWIGLARAVAARGIKVQLPWGSDEEHERAQRIAQNAGEGVAVLPRLSLAALAQALSTSLATVAVDTGPGHLAAALGVPGVSLYGPTDPALIATVGPRQVHLRRGDSMTGIDVNEVLGALDNLLPARPAAVKGGARAC